MNSFMSSFLNPVKDFFLDFLENMGSSDSAPHVIDLFPFFSEQFDPGFTPHFNFFDNFKDNALDLQPSEYFLRGYISHPIPVLSV